MKNNIPILSPSEEFLDDSSLDESISINSDEKQENKVKTEENQPLSPIKICFKQENNKESYSIEEKKPLKDTPKKAKSSKSNKKKSNSAHQEDNEFSEVIEEKVMYIKGSGSGFDCDVGNDKPTLNEEPEKHPPTKPVKLIASSFFFGPGCIKSTSGGSGLFAFNKSATSSTSGSPSKLSPPLTLGDDNKTVLLTSKEDVPGVSINKDNQELDIDIKRIEDALKGEVRCKPGILTPPMKPTSSSASKTDNVVGSAAKCLDFKQGETRKFSLLLSTVF